jgi:hypothetical protein
MTRTVTTTFQPDQEIEVGDVEYAQLKTQGLLVEDLAPEAPAAAAPSATTAKKSTSGAAGSKES